MLIWLLVGVLCGAFLTCLSLVIVDSYLVLHRNPSLGKDVFLVIKLWKVIYNSKQFTVSEEIAIREILKGLELQSESPDIN